MANSRYNGLEISLRHTSGPLTFLAGYTYSKSIDDASSDVDRLIYPFNFRLVRALSAFDSTHNFVMSYSYLLPFRGLARGRFPRLADGWRVTGVARFATGFPVTLSEFDDHALLRGGAFQGEDRPDFAGGNVQAGLHDPRSGLPYFNTNLFSPEQLGQFGTASYRFFHGPGTSNLDFGLLKDVALTEQKRLEFRAEFFNMFNHAQFFNPSGSINSGTFGLVTSARDPRIGQLAIKLLF
jgi:hypothetical protein